MVWREDLGRLTISTGVGPKTQALQIDSSQAATFADVVNIADQKYLCLLGATGNVGLRNDGTGSMYYDADTLNTGANTTHYWTIDGGANLMTLSPAGLGVFGTIDSTGNFSSLGIDDNAVGLRFKLENTIANFGTTGGTYNICHAVDDQLLRLTGGSTVAGGANIRLYGPSHSTDAGDIQFLDSSTLVAKWDSDLDRWAFRAGATPVEVLKITETELTLGDGTAPYTIAQTTTNQALYISGGSAAGTGTAILLYGSGHATAPGDMIFQNDTVDFYKYDQSAGNHVWWCDLAGTVTQSLKLQKNELSLGYTGGSYYDIGHVSNDQYLRIYGGNNSGANLVLYGGSQVGSANDWRIRTGATDVLFWDDDLGKLYISTGTTSALTATFTDENGLTVKGAVAAQGGSLFCDNTGATNMFARRWDTDNTNGAVLGFVKSRSGTIAAPGGIILDADYLGFLRWYGDDGTDTSSWGAEIRVQVDGTPGTDNLPAEMHIRTNSGSSVPTTAIIIDKNQNTTFFGDIVATGGSFVSKGISDTCSGIRMALVDGGCDWGTTGTAFTHRHVVDDSYLQLTGGTAANLGANLVFYGSTHTTGGDLILRHNTDNLLWWDNSANQLILTAPNSGGAIIFRQNGVVEVKITTDTMTLGSNNNFSIQKDVEDDNLMLSGGTAWNSGGGMVMYGTGHGSAGDVYLRSSGQAFLKWQESSGVLSFHTGVGTKTERAKIDINGRARFYKDMGVGHNTIPRSMFDMAGNTGTNAYFQRYSLDATGPIIAFSKSRSGVINGTSPVAVTSADNLGYLRWYADDGTDSLTYSGQIKCSVSGTVSSNSVPTLMTFYTMNSAGVLTANLFITPDGEVRCTKSLAVGATNPTAGPAYIYHDDASTTLTLESGVTTCHAYLNDTGTTANGYVSVSSYGNKLRLRADNYYIATCQDEEFTIQAGNTQVATKPATLRIETQSEGAGTWQGEVYTQLLFAVLGAENSTGDLTDSAIAAIKAVDYRVNATPEFAPTTYEDSGLGFYTLASGDLAPIFRGGFSNKGGFLVSSVFYDVDPDYLYVKGRIGLGTTTPLYKMHLKVGDSGAAPEVWNDDFVIENAGTVGMTLLSPDASPSRIAFGSPSDGEGAKLEYQYNGGAPFLKIGTQLLNGKTQFISGTGDIQVTILSTGYTGFGVTVPLSRFHAYHATDNVIGRFQSGDVGCKITLSDDTETSYIDSQADYLCFGHNSTSANNTLFVMNTGRVGIGTNAPDGKLHVHNGSAGTVTPQVSADDFTVEASGDAGMTLLSPNANLTTLAFGSPIDNRAAIVEWGSTLSRLRVGTSYSGASVLLLTGNGVTALTLDSSQNATFEGEVTTGGELDIQEGSITIRGGADVNLTTRTDATNKMFRLAGVHYTNTASPVGGIIINSTSTGNTVAIGGGSSAVNAATALAFYTGATTTTGTGTLALRIDSNQVVTVEDKLIVEGQNSTVCVLGKTSAVSQDCGGANGTEVWWTWNTQVIVDAAGFTHSTTVNSNRITCVNTGRYRIRFIGGCYNTGTNRATLQGIYRIDGGTTIRSGSIRNYGRGSVYGHISPQLEDIVEITAGSYIEVGTRLEDADVGTYVITAADGTVIQNTECRLIIERI
jgi:hypothetical protein